jgi:ribosomal protein L7/L12
VKEILYGVAIVIALLFLVDKISRARVERLRQQGIYPPAGQETEADVERLLTMGHKIEAIKAYRAIHGVGLKDAKEAVERLAKRLDTERKGA